MEINIAAIPYSRFGSYLAFSLLPAGDNRAAGLYLRSMRGPATGGRPLQEILRMELYDNGKLQDFDVQASFTRLNLSSSDGQANICLPDADSVRIHLQNTGLRFSMPAGYYDNLIPGKNQEWLLTVNTIVETKLRFSAIKGSIVVEAPWQAEHSEHIVLTLIPGEDGAGDFAIDESTVNWSEKSHTQPYAACLLQVDAELDDFTASLPQVPDEYAASRRLAGYVLWSCVVQPQSHLTRPAIFASKNGMLGTWSWDHAFHSLALADSQPHLAWDQIMAIFDHQDDSGVLPDLVNDRLVSWSFSKPPVHGWILSRLLKNTKLLSKDRLREIYPLLCRWTEWWFEYRDSNSNGIPQCNHGNDSGWDNSTVFAVRPPVESPDICAYLVLQMDFLAEAATYLGKPDEVAIWASRADSLVQNLIVHFWRKDHFVAVQSSKLVDIESQSLQLYLPLLLGKRLPTEVRHALVTRLKKPGEFLTSYGLATENLNSPLYRSRGYWRGPIWPAPMLILIDALDACGEFDFAIDLRRRFCDLVNHSGMAENFDAQTGQGYHDFHFSWTAGIFLTLAHELL